VFEHFAKSVCGFPGITVPWEQILALIATLLDGCNNNARQLSALINRPNLVQRLRLRVACYKQYGTNQGEIIAAAILKQLPKSVAEARGEFAGELELEERLLAELGEIV
jgi:hypothetical protein